MKVLTVRQPFASLIISGAKGVECRTWPVSYRGPLLIHAAQRPDPGARAFLSELGVDPPALMPSGVILGSVVLADVVTDSDSPWAEPDNFHWLLTGPRPWAEPVPARGALGLWNWTPEGGEPE